MGTGTANEMTIDVQGELTDGRKRIGAGIKVGIKNVRGMIEEAGTEMIEGSETIGRETGEPSIDC
jgi:hypothetical protein